LGKKTYGTPNDHTTLSQAGFQT